MIGENFPYTNFHDMNMDWLIKIAKDFLDQYTQIQQIIEDGETALEEKTASGLSDLQDKYDTLEGLLNSWYEEHSEDISAELADALQDLNDWYTTHENYLNNTLSAKIAEFNTAAETKLSTTLESIPDDYSELAQAFQTYVMNPSRNNQEDLAYNVLTDKYIKDTDGTLGTLGNVKYCVSTPISVEQGERLVLNLTALYNNLAIAFYTDADVFISGIYNSQGDSAGTNLWRFTNYVVNVPENAKIARIGWYSDYPHAFTRYTVLIEKLSDIILPNTIDELITPAYSVVSGSFIQDAVEHTGAGNSWKLTNAISVQPGERYIYTGYMNFNCYIVAFYSNGSLIDGFTANIGETVASNMYYNENFEFVVPAYVDHMKIGYFIAGEYEQFSIKKHNVKLVAEEYKPWKNKKWVCMGDSITSNENSTATKRYYEYISEMTEISPVIMAHDGSGYKRDENNEQAFYQVAANIPTDADVITIFGSFNDLGSTYQLGTKLDTGTTTIGGCINTTLDNIFNRIPLANVGIVAPCPWSNHWAGSQYSDTTKAYVNLIKEICEYRSIPFLNMFTESGLRPWDATFRQYAYTRDNGGGTHPDEHGHKLLSTKFEAFLNKLLLR